ncbi:MAG: regulatory protein RecX [Gammaproteobacteria bacterium]
MRAYHTAVNLLSRREHSTTELRRKLTGQGLDDSELDKVLARLTRDKLLSDERFVESFIQSRVSKGVGPLLIQAQLHERGIDSMLSAEFLDTHARQWRELAQTAQRKRFGETLPQNYTERAKQMRFLQQRGFTMEQINAAFKPNEDD